jgi:hypothetical protein
MNKYYFITTKLCTYTILFIYTSIFIIIVILQNFWPIFPWHSNKKQTYPINLSYYLQTLDKSVLTYFNKNLTPLAYLTSKTAEYKNTTRIKL